MAGRHIFATALVFAAVFDLGLGTPARAGEAAPAVSTFVVLGPQGAIARVITAAPNCPSLTVDGRRLDMTIRAQPQTIPVRPPRQATAAAKPASFPVLTCETVVPKGVRMARIGGISLPLPPARIRKIAVIGDTGCRTPIQACNAADRFPFARIAASIAAWKPDLVLHVGDYHYREAPCRPESVGCLGSAWGYGFDAWNADFFEPAAPLLRAAPWVLVRGNHESCSRAGQGWWRFLDPHPMLPRGDCNDPLDDQIGDYSSPYAVALSRNWRLIVYDSSNVPAAGDFPPGDPRPARYAADVTEIQRLAAGAAHNILADHHPMLGVGARPGSEGSVRLYPANVALQSLFRAAEPYLAPPSVDLLLSGHIHLWEAVGFSTPHPAQIIVGMSGTEEDIVPLPVIPDMAPAPGAEVETMSSWIAGFGFMTLESTGRESWRLQVHDAGGKVVNTCRLKAKRLRCALRRVGQSPGA
ncbi:MAG: metallophosphoesterase [Caulobacteraceae bacterium]